MQNAKLYTGRSGELAVLSEFLSRGYNAASPEVDRGEDIFVIEDEKGQYWPIQVKTGRATEKRSDYWTGQFTFRRDQLVTPTLPELTYVLALRRHRNWSSFLVIPRKELARRYRAGELGSQKKRMITLVVQYHPLEIRCHNSDLTQFEGAFDSEWPDLIGA